MSAFSQNRRNKHFIKTRTPATEIRARRSPANVGLEAAKRFGSPDRCRSVILRPGVLWTFGFRNRFRKGDRLSFNQVDWERLLATVQADRPDLYRAWFAALPTGRLDRGQLDIRVPDAAQAHFLREQCTDVFISAAMKVSGHLVAVRFLAPDDERLEASPLQDYSLSTAPVDPDYTFDEFVVGPSNRLAHAACRALCTQPGQLYNPLFIHGPSGLGKTHLLQATCSELIRVQGAANAAYVTCESFVNDFVRAIRDGQLPAFRAGARRLDLLVIDDVQFLANRESCQEELFHTFNTLHQARKQIILSADSPPGAIPTLEDRLVSRFNWGLVAQIDPPDRETRQAILQKKAQLRGTEVPSDVLDYLAEHIEGNIRLLEGALTKLITASQVDGQPPSVQTARRVFPSQNPGVTRPLQVGEILEAVARHFGIRTPELLGRKRNRSVSHPRQVAMYLARKLTPLSLQEIGAHFGGRDHSTVLHAERAIEEERQAAPELGRAITELTSRLSLRE